MKLTRYSDTAPIDYMVLADDGEWVPASEALALQERLALAIDLLREAGSLAPDGWEERRDALITSA